VRREEHHDLVACHLGVLAERDLEPTGSVENAPVQRRDLICAADGAGQRVVETHQRIVTPN
jgi:hypothetical protein